jgi:hypothetical protein
MTKGRGRKKCEREVKEEGKKAFAREMKFI